MADISPETAGVVTDIRVEEGDQVRKGQVLGVLSNPSLEAGSERASVEPKAGAADGQCAALSPALPLAHLSAYFCHSSSLSS